MNVNGFFVAPFSVDGHSLGVDFFANDSLSPKWVSTCNRLIEKNGPVFETDVGDALPVGRVRLSSTKGMGLVSVSVSNQLAASALLLSESPSVQDHEVMSMYIESLLRTDIVRRHASPRSFESMTSIVERPLLIVVPFPLGNGALQNEEVAKELLLHFAGAFFCVRK